MAAFAVLGTIRCSTAASTPKATPTTSSPSTVPTAPSSTPAHLRAAPPCWDWCVDGRCHSCIGEPTLPRGCSGSERPDNELVRSPLTQNGAGGPRRPRGRRHHRLPLLCVLEGADRLMVAEKLERSPRQPRGLVG